MRSVAGRMLEVLDALSAERTTLSLSEISRRTDLPLSTAHRLVGELARWGALEQDDQGRYHIGLRLWEAAALAPRSVGLREAALPFLEDLYEITHENVQLAVRDDLDVVFVERICGRNAVGSSPVSAAASRCTRPASVSPSWPTRPPRCRNGRSPRHLRATPRRRWPTPLCCDER